MKPAEILEVRFDPENDRACTVVVPDDQLSLAIGKRGQNARLAAHLTGYKIDIKPESEADVDSNETAQTVEPTFSLDDIEGLDEE